MSPNLPRVVLHQDDVGMCHGANTAFVELSRAGTITSGSVMVPCPWFSEIAEIVAADTTQSFDLGVHLTLTAEKQHYRWGPLTRPSISAGLTDDDGYLWRDVSSVRRHAQPEAVGAEMRAQVQRAFDAGLDVTHIDAHMGAALAPEFVDSYVALGIEFGVPVLLTHTIEAYGPRNHLLGVDDETYAASPEAAAASGMPLFDAVLETDWSRPQHSNAQAAHRSLVGGIAHGLTFICLHPNAPGELAFIEPASAYIRTDEYDVLRSAEHAAWLADQPLELTGMRHLH